MAHFTVDISTEPLAEHVEAMSATVRTVGTTVDDMSNKLVAAEAMAAETVSSNVTYGFYMLTRNQFMQKTVALENDVRMIFLKVKTYSDQLRDVQKRMEKDYGLISRQYIKIFNNIDASLKTAVRELDQAVMDIVVSGRQKLSERMLDGSTKAVSYPSDLLPISQSMISVKLKRKAQSVLHSLRSLISAERTLSEKMSGTLAPEKVEEEETVYFPVVLIESDSKDDGSSVMEIHMPNFPSEMASQSGSIFSRVITLKGSEELWQKGRKEQKQLIRQEFDKLLGTLSPRKREVMSKLFDNSSWEELKGAE